MENVFNSKSAKKKVYGGEVIQSTNKAVVGSIDSNEFANIDPATTPTTKYMKKTK